MMVELMPNRENFEDVYLSDSDDEDADDSDNDEFESDTESELTKALKEESNQNDVALKKAREDKASASSRLAILENYGRSLEKDRPEDLEACVLAYGKERRKTFQDHLNSEANIKALEFECTKIQNKQAKALRTTMKEKEKAAKEKAKKLEKKRHAHQEKLDAKRRLKDERIQFWPREVYRVVLSLDTNSDMTPASSRRGSIDSLAKPMSEKSSGPCQISLSISYITSGAYWAPRYDVSLNTLDSSGLIIYRAEFCNTTSETWKDAKVILSTSQTSFQGLGEPIPFLLPWHIRLNKGFGKDADGTSGALVSTYEMEHKQKVQMAVSNKASEPRNALFGLGNKDGVSIQPRTQASQAFGQHYPQQYQQAPQQPSHAMPQMRMAMQQAPQGGHGGLFGQSSLGRTAPDAARGARQDLVEESYDFSAQGLEAEYDEGNAETIIPDLPTLATQEPTWSESGLTATYDIPGLRTIAPSNTTRRQKIASITLKDIHLSYLLVPKLRAAAFLKARFRNTSTIALLKGPAGLTLDGSFLGNTNLPRCSAGESFNLSLGVDPSVNVTYSKPVVKRSQNGVFNKEGSGVYTRTCTVTNTKSNRALEGLVLDQIPVSEDERLKVGVLQPSGLRNEGDVAKSGVGIAALGKSTEKWGRATAVLKKGGEVCWDVKIEPGRGVKLVLEYEARFPSTEMVVGV